MRRAIHQALAVCMLSCVVSADCHATDGAPDSGCVDACPADVDGDEAVGMGDVLAILSDWGDCPPTGGCPGDLNEDDVVDFADVLAVLAQWGPCPERNLFSGPWLDVGSSVDSMAIADFNGDGAPDVALADGDVTVVLNEGEGRLRVVATLPMETSSTRLATGDFDGDGNTDIVVSEGGRDRVMVFLGDGRGAFATKPRITAVEDPTTLLAVDFDADGLLDLATNSGGALTIMRNVGSGLFDTPLMLDVGAYAYFRTAGDFNGDGLPDLVAATVERTVVILVNEGAGSFSMTTIASNGGSVGDVETLDFDNDGDIDLAVSRGWGSNDVLLLRNDGFGSFVAGSAFPVGPDSSDLAVGDFNGDGRLDLAAVTEWTLAILLGDGKGQFGEPHLVPPSAREITVLDLNADGHDDLLTAGFYRSLSIRFGDGRGSFGAVHVPTTGAPLDMTLSEVTGDEHLDIVALTRAGAVSIRPGDGNGSFGASGDFSVSPSSEVMVGGDIDGDGDFDLAVSDVTIDTVWILPNNGTGGFGSPFGLAVSRKPHVLALGDVDGNGRPDLVVSTGGHVEIWHNQGGAFGAPSVIEGIPGRQRAMLLQDLDGDFDLDLIVTRNGGTVLMNNGTGVFGDARTFGGGNELATADIDHDGDFDILSMNYSEVHLFRNDGNAQFVATLLHTDSEQLADFALGDIETDGDLDIVLSLSGRIRVLANDGDGLFAPPLTFPAAGLRYGKVDVGDLDGDGDVDVATFSCTGIGEVDFPICNAGGIAVLFNRSLPCRTE